MTPCFVLVFNFIDVLAMVCTANAYQSGSLLLCGADRIEKLCRVPLHKCTRSVKRKMRTKKESERNDYLCQCCLFNVGCASSVACTDRSALILFVASSLYVSFFIFHFLFIERRNGIFGPSLFFFVVCMYVALRLCAIGIMCSKAF